jgi:hypothetical protein
MLMKKHGMLGIIIALSIAMVGATIVVSYGAIQVEAAPKFNWCFTAASLVCRDANGPFNGKGDCKKLEEETAGVVQPCHKVFIS